MKKLSRGSAAVALLSLFAIFGNTLEADAETYSLTAKSLYNAMPDAGAEEPVFMDANRIIDFESDGLQCRLEFIAHPQYVFEGMDWYSYLVSNPPTVTFNPSGNNHGKVILTIEAPEFEHVGSVNGKLGFMTADSQTLVTYNLSIGSYKGVTHGDGRSYREFESDNPIQFTINEPASGKLSLEIETEPGGRFYFGHLTINTVAPIAHDPVMAITIPVGHALTMECPDEADSEIFYRIGESDNWSAYDEKRGIVFETPGDYVVEYYAAVDGKVNSRIQRENISVIAPSGISFARVAASPVDVSGVVVSHENAYTFIGHSENATEEECIAVDHSQSQALAAARIGSTVELTARPTDRFDVPALASLSRLVINGSDQTTAISQIAEPTPREEQFYDLQGRRVSKNTPGPRIVLSTSGRKTLLR